MAAAYEKAKIEIKAVAQKQLGIDLSVVSPLVDSEWPDFLQQIKTCVFRNEWEPGVLNYKDDAGADIAIPPHVNADRDEVIFKLHANIKNCYQVLVTKCEKHPVSALLKTIVIGDSRAVWKAITGHFVRTTAAGRAFATDKFYTSTMANTDTSLLDWIKTVNDLADSLETATRVTVPAGAKKHLLLSGLLPEFKLKKQMIQSQDKGDTLTLSECVDDLIDYAKEENLMDIKKGTSQRRNQSYYGQHDEEKGNGQSRNVQSKNVPQKKGFRENLATQQCKHWTAGTCVHGANCYRQHKGPGGCTANAPTAKTQKSTPLPTPSAPSLDCHFCSTTGHAMKDCPDFKRSVSMGHTKGQVMYAGDDSDGPAFSFPVMHEELPDNEEEEAHHPNTYFKILKVLFCSIMVAPIFYGFRRILKSCVPTILLLAVFAALASYALAAPAQSTSSYVRSSSYFNSDCKDSLELEWLADPGTNRFVTNNIKDFIPGTIVYSPLNVAVGGGTTTSPCAGSILVFSLDHNITIRCDDVILLPKCAKKLMPAYQFTKKGCTLEFGTEVHLRSKEGTPILSGPEIGGLFYFRAKTLQATKISSSDKNVVNATSLFGLLASESATNAGVDFPRRLLEAHWSYGHLQFDKLRKLLGLKKGNDPDCPICTIMKQKQAALADETKKVRSTRPCHRMHMDIGYTAGSDYIFALYVDDYARISYLDVLDSKSQSLEKWCELKHKLENEFMPWKFAIIFTDSEPLYFTPGWEQHCKDQGLEHEFSSRHKHGQNGVVERAMQTVGITFRCMMMTGNAPARCIPAALIFSNVIRNHSPTKANQGMTPLEKGQGCKLPINQRLLRGPLFCLVFAFVYETERIKHAPRGVACVYLGYDPRNNTYLVMEWKSGREYYTADLQFHKTVFPFRANPDRTLPSLNVWDDIAPHVTELIGPEEKVEQTESLRLADYANKQLRGEGKSQPASARLRLPSSQALKNIPDIDIAPDSSTLQSYHLGVDPAQVAATFVVQGYGPDPDSMEEAIQMEDGDQWILADISEKLSWDEREAVEIVPRSMAVSRGKRIFKAKRVFKKKFLPPDATHPEGKLEKYKVRLTIAAYTRMLTEGIDYADKHASTVRWSAIKMIIAIATKFDYDLVLLDISTFFLYGECKEEMYMEIPEGWGKDGKDADSGYIFRLKKTVYGLPQASNAAQKELKDAFSKKGEFRSTSGDDCVYVSTSWGKSNDDDSTKGYCVCGAHVDDIVAAVDSEGKEKLIKTLEAKFKITKKFNPTCITGVQIERVRGKNGWTKLHLTEYTANFLKEQKMEGARPVDTPMDPGTAKSLMELPQDEFTKESVKAYQEIMGSLIWLLRIRADLDFSVNLGSRFIRCASQKHIDLVRGRILRYLNGTVNYGLVFSPGRADWVLSGCSDADLAGDVKSARSTLSYNTQIGEFGCISSSSFLERKICTSTGQAESYAYARLCREVIWERNMLREMGFPQLKPTKIQTDNQGVLIQSEKSVNHSVAKHYRIAQAFIRQLVASGVVKGSDVRSGENSSDIGTKPLLSEPFIRHRLAIMGPQEPPLI